MNYKTNKGDAWDEVAYKTGGTEEGMAILIFLNPDHRHSFFLPGDLIFTLPSKSEEPARPLAPWRR